MGKLGWKWLDRSVLPLQLHFFTSHHTTTPHLYTTPTKYLNRFTTASARGVFDYDLNNRTWNNGAKDIVKHFNTSVAQHFCPIKITTTWNALPNEVVTSRTVKSFKNS